MRTALSILLVILPGAHARMAAETLAVSALPAPAFADTEISEDFAFHVEDAADGCLRVRMSLDAEATNALSVTFGKDVWTRRTGAADARSAASAKLVFPPRIWTGEYRLELGWKCPSPRVEISITKGNHLSPLRC